MSTPEQDAFVIKVREADKALSAIAEASRTAEQKLALTYLKEQVAAADAHKEVFYLGNTWSKAHKVEEADKAKALGAIEAALPGFTKAMEPAFPGSSTASFTYTPGSDPVAPAPDASKKKKKGAEEEESKGPLSDNMGGIIGLLVGGIFAYMTSNAGGMFGSIGGFVMGLLAVVAVVVGINHDKNGILAEPFKEAKKALGFKQAVTAVSKEKPTVEKNGPALKVKDSATPDLITNTEKDDKDRTIETIVHQQNFKDSPDPKNPDKTLIGAIQMPDGFKLELETVTDTNVGDGRKPTKLIAKTGFLLVEAEEGKVTRIPIDLAKTPIEIPILQSSSQADLAKASTAIGDATKELINNYRAQQDVARLMKPIELLPPSKNGALPDATTIEKPASFIYHAPREDGKLVDISVSGTIVNKGGKLMLQFNSASADQVNDSGDVIKEGKALKSIKEVELVAGKDILDTLTKNAEVIDEALLAQESDVFKGHGAGTARTPRAARKSGR